MFRSLFISYSFIFGVLVFTVDVAVAKGHVEVRIQEPNSTIFERSEKVLERVKGLDFSDEMTSSDVLSQIADEYENFGALQSKKNSGKNELESALKFLNESRMLIRTKLKNREAEVGLAGNALVSSIRKFSFIIRGVEEMIGERIIGFQRLKKKEKPITTLSGSFPNLIVHPPFDSSDVELKSGDVLMARGNFHTSSAISQFGIHNSPYSHNVLIYIDPSTGKKYALEALIEEGLVIQDLSYILNEGYGRITLMRYPDENIAKKAAEIVYKRAYQAHLDKTNKKIFSAPYGFSMEIFKKGSDGQYLLDQKGKKIPDYSNVFCSKVIFYGYERATDGDLILGKYWNQFPQEKNGEFLKMLGVTANESFLPSDFEVETRFDIVADWKDYRVTPDLRMREAISYAMFDWIENEGYRFKSNKFMDDLSKVAKAGSKVVPPLQKRIPSYMTADVFKGSVLLHLTAEAFHKDISNDDLKSSAERQAPYSFYEIQRNLKSMRDSKGAKLKYLKKY